MFTFLITLAFLIPQIFGHGMMLEPPNRSSLWRFNESAPPNYNDNQNFCGGYFFQWELNGGKCGVCGDVYTDPHPQDNENTGLYGQGNVVRRYKSGTAIDVTVDLTQNHLGTFNFSLCELIDPLAPESGEECFEPLSLEDGSTQYHVAKTDSVVQLRVQLPEKLCERCVFRWNYRTGNNWGDCEDGTQGMGCGPQEHFRNCADIAID